MRSASLDSGSLSPTCVCVCMCVCGGGGLLVCVCVCVRAVCDHSIVVSVECFV